MILCFKYECYRYKDSTAGFPFSLKTGALLMESCFQIHDLGRYTEQDNTKHCTLACQHFQHEQHRFHAQPLSKADTPEDIL